MKVPLAWLLLTALTGCMAPAKPAPSLPSSMFAACEPAVTEPLPPPKPRTAESIAAWGTRTQIALRLANRRLAACEGHRADIIRHLTEIPALP